jgi:hypothetical protein
MAYYLDLAIEALAVEEIDITLRKEERQAILNRSRSDLACQRMRTSAVPED